MKALVEGGWPRARTHVWQAGYATLAHANGVFAAPAREYDFVVKPLGGTRTYVIGVE